VTPASVTDLPPIFGGIEAVCFDAFGTLVEIMDRQQAFRPLFNALSPEKRHELRHRLMREDRPFTDWPKALGVDVDPYVLLDVLNRNLGEMLSIRMRPHMAEAWAILRHNGVRIGICSNLSSDYVQSLQSALPDALDLAVLSCKVGAIKPEPAIYAAVLDGLQVTPDKVLFVGDTPRADIEGPRAAGMKAIHVDELVAVMFPD
jgi:HAD superfamily hydrolase (TIGR01549 family)